MKSTVIIQIIFLEDNFYHIAGLHKLTDIKDLIDSRNKKLFFKSFFKKSCKDKIISRICNSVHFDEIVDRLKSIIAFESNLMNNCMNGKYIKFYENRLVFISRINYDYVLIITDDNGDSYHYFIKTKSNDESIIVSAFINNTDNYWKNQKLMILSKIDLNADNKIICIYKK